jgi:hypothetical protein
MEREGRGEEMRWREGRKEIKEKEGKVGNRR